MLLMTPAVLVMMSAWLSLVCAVSVLLVASATSSYNRDALINAAIEEVQDAKIAEQRVLTTAEKRMKAFKIASKEALAQGVARVAFERMVRKAEHKILQHRRQQMAMSQTAQEKAESLAMEVFHKPGSVLKSEEIAKIYEASQCNTTLTRLQRPCRVCSKFRTPSGVCNNLRNPTYGAANTLMRRLIPARYDDGISRLRGTLQIKRSSIVPGPFSPPVPSPRVVSLGIVGDREVNDSKLSHIMMQWGQFMDHDLDFIPEFTHEQCPASCNVREDSCVPFPVPRDDGNVEVVAGTPNSCHEFRRSLPACDTSTPDVLSVREQFNGISHFIDGSMIYHHNDEVFRTMIRNASSRDGLLNVGPPARGTNQESLPMIDATDGPVICMNPPCFLAGDLRVNEQASLTVMHTLWVREHNRIARALRASNPGVSSTTIFETARSIVIAEVQKITYKDYLPLLLGDNFAKLIPSYQRYDSTVFPNIPNAFATAAYRFGHSQIQPAFVRLGADYKPIAAGPLPLVDAFFNNSHFLENGGTDPILRGLLATPAREVDEFLNSVLTNLLFASNASSHGFDLASLNIQRGRDHGLASYLAWKQWAKRECNLESDFRNELTMVRLLQTYGSLNNVDLFVGGLAEEPIDNGVVGAVFACIFAKTFMALRDGDRFYYENSDRSFSSSFTAAQIAQINTASLSRVICDNTDIGSVQRNAFLATNNRKERVECSSIPSINLKAWNLRPPTLPRSCFLRVQNMDRRRNRITVMSRIGRSRRFATRRITLRGRRSGCLQIACPRPRAEVRITNSLRCPITAPGCFRSLRRVRETFRRFLSPSNVCPANAIHTSSSQCRRSRRPAFSFCSRWLAEVESTDMDFPIQEDTDEDNTVINEEEMKKILLEDIEPENLEQVLQEDIDDDNLVGEMEEALLELNENDEEENVDEKDDESAMKKLEEALRSIQ